MAQSRRIAIPELPGGTWRVQWLGNLRTTNHTPNRVGYEVRLHLSWAGKGHREPKSEWVPLSNLFYLRTQSRWEDREFVEHCGAEARTFGVFTAGAKNLDVHKPYENYLIRFHDYDLQGFDSHASCWIFNTTENEELVVPCWEILRAWYLFDHGVMPAVLAGAITNLDSLPTRHKPWREGTGLTQDGKRQYVYPNWLGEAGARKFARLYFDAFANSEARKIYSQLMSTSGQSEGGWTECRIPAVLPPFEALSRWTVKCVPLQPLRKGGGKRWLVLDLKRADAPLPFSDLDLLPHKDFRRGLNANDPTLPTREVPSKAHVSLPDGLVELVPIAPDDSVEDVGIEGFDFDDNITRDLVVHTPDKIEQVSHVIHLPSKDVATKSGGTDPAGPKSSSAASVRVKDGDAPLAKDALLEQTLRAYALVIHEYPESQLIRSTGSVFVATNARSRVVRQFAILEMSLMNRVAYVLDAQRFGSEEFPFFVCRHPSRERYPPSVFQTWLREFPAPQGSPWQVERGLPRGLLWNPRRLKHQPKDNSDVERRIRRLAIRIEAALNRLLGG